MLGVQKELDLARNSLAGDPQVGKGLDPVVASDRVVMYRPTPLGNPKGSRIWEDLFPKSWKSLLKIT